MKVLCINNEYSYLTIGKWYEVIFQDEEHYYVIDDDCNKCWYPKRFFKTQKEIRDEKLNELGI